MGHWEVEEKNKAFIKQRSHNAGDDAPDAREKTRRCSFFVFLSSIFLCQPIFLDKE